MCSSKSSGANKCINCRHEEVELGERYCPSCLTKFYGELDDLDVLYGFAEDHEREVASDSSSDVNEYNE